MSEERAPSPGTCIGMNFRYIDANQNEVALERCHGIVESADADGYVVILGGANLGERVNVPPDAQWLALPGGMFFFPDSNEWISPAFFIEGKVFERRPDEA
jgi:hypothetical protein